MIVTIVLNIASYIILAALLCFELLPEGKLDSGLDRGLESGLHPGLEIGL